MHMSVVVVQSICAQCILTSYWERKTGGKQEAQVGYPIYIYIIKEQFGHCRCVFITNNKAYM